MIGLAGARPAFDLVQDSPQISMEEVVRREPDVLLLTAGEQGTAAARLAAAPGWRDLRAVREGRVAVVDADLVRPGPGIGRMARTIRDSLRAVLVRHPL
jgi:iron complex transport system substrate-binding protein